MPTLRAFRCAVLGALLGATLAAAPSAFAASYTYGLTAGGTFPINDLANAVGAGFNIGGTAYWRTSNLLDLGVDVDAHFLPGSSDLEKAVSAAAGTPVDYDATVIPISFYGRYRVPIDENITPFLKLGLGIYTVQSEYSVDVQDRDYFDNGTKFGVDFGGGIELQMTPTWALGADLMYHWINNDPDAAQMVVLRAMVLFAGPE